MEAEVKPQFIHRGGAEDAEDRREDLNFLIWLHMLGLICSFCKEILAHPLDDEVKTLYSPPPRC